jgi:hypothetical protein
MSLYFYNTSEQDEIILRRIDTYPKKIRDIIFNNEYYWYRNRPDSNAWINYLSIVDIKWKHEAQKRHLSELFTKSIEDVQGEPWVLR